MAQRTDLAGVLHADLDNFPHVEKHACKPAYDNIPFRHDEEAFRRWCEGTTGYPIVDAGMRQLNATGFMHNRVRMIAASFLVKHLLIDWRWEGLLWPQTAGLRTGQQ